MYSKFRFLSPGRARFLAALIVLLIASCRAPGTDAPGEAPKPVERLTFAGTLEFWTAPTLIADLRDLYGDVGLEVEVADFPTGLAAKNAVLNRKTDLGLVADTPVAMAGFQGEEIRIIATYFQSDTILRLVADTGGERLTPGFLVGRRVGFVQGTISEQFLERMIQRYGLPREEIEMISFRPIDMVHSLVRGDIDAFVGWEPLGIYAEREFAKLGRADCVTSWNNPDLYTVSLHIVTRPDVIAEKPEALEKFVRALHLARDAIATEPDGTRADIEEILGFEPGELAPYWNREEMKLDFEVRLNREDLVGKFELEAEWLKQAGYAEGVIPAYGLLIDESIYETVAASRSTAGSEETD